MGNPQPLGNVNNCAVQDMSRLSTHKHPGMLCHGSDATEIATGREPGAAMLRVTPCDNVARTAEMRR